MMDQLDLSTLKARSRIRHSAGYHDTRVLCGLKRFMSLLDPE